MTKEEAKLIIDGFNEILRNTCSFDDAESNDCLEKGWFSEKDIIDCGVTIGEELFHP